MATQLHDSPIFGPVHSRRLGLSLGINLMPPDGKICTFDCIYCECGYNSDNHPHSRRPSREVVKQHLERWLIDMNNRKTFPDVLTFSGNGEPTAHPDFGLIIEDTIRLRNRYVPRAKISVLSNATMIHRIKVREALMKVDMNILKLDAVDNSLSEILDRPNISSYDPAEIIKYMKAFHGHLIIQTIFLKGIDDEGNETDNTSERYLAPWLEALKVIRPQSVMVYTIDRETPAKGLKKADPSMLDAICRRVKALEIPCSVAY
ncbi:MAG: radical SAM protein [Prevotella sp.]|nr:radical SAM protein [Prevotella sp.]